MNLFKNKHMKTLSRCYSFSKERIINDNSFGKYEIVKPWPLSLIDNELPIDINKPPYYKSKEPLETRENIEIKNESQIKLMRRSCQLAKTILNDIQRFVKVGVTTDSIDRLTHKMIINEGAYPSPLFYKNFPKSICTSVNNVACHGIPDTRPLSDGDIVNVDITVYLNGYHGDCSSTFLVGDVDSEGKRLVDVTQKCLNAAIKICKPNEKFSSIGAVIEDLANNEGFSVVPVFAGHGIGSYFHGPPDIFHFENDLPGEMKPGMTFTIEPILSQGSWEITVLDDNWTAVTVDNSRTAQSEHTILITDYGCEILTN